MYFFTYIIYSKDLNKYYVGYTENIEVRMKQHNTGISTFTAKATDWTLMFQEAFLTRQEAQHRESEIKKKKSRKYIEWLINRSS
ncbi:MAG: GIY-YIG nuclease family protein [Chitinophagaceae bacterium]|nr:GIY-YIG nuclease family protein [Chitinophagaceae bacterium]